MWETCSDNMCFLSSRSPQKYDHKIHIYISFLLKSKPISNKVKIIQFSLMVSTKENCTTPWPQTRIGTRTRAKNQNMASQAFGLELNKDQNCEMQFRGEWLVSTGSQTGPNMISTQYQLGHNLIPSWYQLGPNWS